MRDPSGKIAASWRDAEKLREKMAGKVVFTNGVFDLLHPGHVRRAPFELLNRLHMPRLPAQDDHAGDHLEVDRARQ